jgi:hypothetical protein
MTTNEAVAYIESWMKLNNDKLEHCRHSDKNVQRHLEKCELALRIIKQDLAGGHQHYVPDHNLQ